MKAGFFDEIEYVFGKISGTCFVKGIYNDEISVPFAVYANREKLSEQVVDAVPAAADIKLAVGK